MPKLLDLHQNKPEFCESGFLVMIIGIVGLGLIGGSLGLDFRAGGHRVVGVSRRQRTGEQAIAMGAVDEASTEFEVLGQADVIFICTPLGAMAATVAQLVPTLRPGVVLTDVGSVKGWVMETVAPLWPWFVGGHPMAGKAESGIEVAQPGLFVDCAYVLTPTEQTPPEAIARVEQLARSLRSRIFYCQPEEHDQAVAWISHLPVLVSASLLAACTQEAEPAVQTLAQSLASSGFRDTSRVGGGNPELGVMMARYNTQALLRSLAAYRATLDGLMQQVEQQDWAGLEAVLQQTQQIRPRFVAS